MEQMTEYRTYIENIIKEYGQYKPSYGDVEMQIMFDTVSPGIKTGAYMAVCCILI